MYDLNSDAYSTCIVSTLLLPTIIPDNMGHAYEWAILSRSNIVEGTFLRFNEMPLTQPIQKMLGKSMLKTFNEERAAMRKSRLGWSDVLFSLGMERVEEEFGIPEISASERGQPSSWNHIWNEIYPHVRDAHRTVPEEALEAAILSTEIGKDVHVQLLYTV